jgi:predicted phage terminase large subunit-like protein
MSSYVEEFDPETGEFSDVEEENERDPVLDLIASDLATYASYIHEGYEPSLYHHIICKELMKCMTGETKRLIIEAPPQHGKSKTATEIFPSFYFGHFPKNSLIVAGYGQDKADDFGRATKGYMDTPAYTQVFPQTEISSKSDSIRRFETTQGGMYFCVGVGGAITGRGANGLIFDDPYKNRKEADSETISEGIRDWYTSTFRTRLRGDGFIILIQTRWNRRDLIQHILDTQGDEEDKFKWRIIKLRALIEDEEEAKDDILKRKVGEALWPEVFPPEILRQTKKDVGTRDWNALYQQNPSDQKGEIFLREYWRYWCKRNCAADHVHTYLPDHFDKSMQMWDCAFKDLATSDYVVGLAGATKDGNLYILDRKKKIANVTKTKEMIMELSALFPWITRKGVEDKANGPAVISELQSKLPGMVAVKAEGSKESRWNAAVPAIESGNVYLPFGAYWVDDFVECTAAVPHGKHDDDADAVSHLILQMLGNRLTGILEWMREQAQKVLNKRNDNG